MKYVATVVFLLSTFLNVSAQDTTIVLSTSMFNAQGRINLGEIEHWIFKQGNDPSWADPGKSVNNWQHLNPEEITKKLADQNGRLEGWFRMKIKLDSSFSQVSLFILQRSYLATEIFINGKRLYSFGNTGYNGKPYHEFVDFGKFPEAIKLEMGKELLLAVHFVDYTNYKNQVKESSFTKNGFIAIANPVSLAEYHADLMHWRGFIVIMTILGVLVVLFWFLFLLNRSEAHLVHVALSTTGLFGLVFSHILKGMAFTTYNQTQLLMFFSILCLAGMVNSLPILVAKVFKNKIPLILKVYAIVFMILNGIAFYADSEKIWPINALFSLLICTYYLVVSRKTLQGAKWAIVIGLITTLLISLSLGVIDNFFIPNLSNTFYFILLCGGYLSFPVSLLVYVALWMKEINKDILSKAEKLVQVTEEKREILASQNRLLEEQVEERTAELSQSLENLKATQTQLIQSEKMASLGELTAGIAHEIQNPLNFVNNFSDVNKELLEELKEEADKGNLEEVIAIATDVIGNEEKINHHGKRADAIVKGMLQHSQSNKGVRELTNINALADEYLRLSYHGLRAKDKSFNASFETHFDDGIPAIEIVPQDMGRVLLNLINNAFYAVKSVEKPLVVIKTEQNQNQIIISVMDNGTGIPEDVKSKIFQPFFTTKPAGQGTGLGLSLSYDIVKAHGGEIKIGNLTTGQVGTTFIITLPVSNQTL